MYINSTCAYIETNIHTRQLPLQYKTRPNGPFCHIDAVLAYGFKVYKAYLKILFTRLHSTNPTVGGHTSYTFIETNLGQNSATVMFSRGKFNRGRQIQLS